MGKSASKAEDAHDNSNKRWFKMSTTRRKLKH